MNNVIVFGTFDLVHPGHKSFLHQAKKLGNFLLVAVARDRHVLRAKGRQPDWNEKKRLLAIRRLGIANKVILGSRTHNYFRTLRSYKIDLIALGYDQKPTTNDLKKELRRHRLNKIKIVRLRGYRPDRYKSSKLRTLI